MDEPQAMKLYENREEEVLIRLLLKFHRETRCGHRSHWAECEAAVDVLGWSSYDKFEIAGLNRKRYLVLREEYDRMVAAHEERSLLR